MTSTPKRKLIEVALPLEAINRESAREKSIRHGHPSTLHLWWARRPLAACRAVLFAQLVDDPSSHPDKFPTEEDQAAERRRLFDIIERLVVWENTTDEGLLREAHEEILKSTDGNPPPILDPFAGGGSIPLEAQRLGLESHASDLNPVPVLINKALIEIPSKWAGMPPVFPGAAEEKLGDWTRATGLAEDVRRYGKWMRDEAEKRIGHLYPKARLEDGSEAKVIAWIWARTVKCPNPACGIRMPLVKSWWLGKKKGNEAYVVARVDGGEVSFAIGRDSKEAPTKSTDGTTRRTGAVCIGCGDVAPLSHVRTEGKAKRIGQKLMAIVAEGPRSRIYLPPNAVHEKAAMIDRPDGVPDTELPKAALGFRVQGYGMTHHADLFTNRQLTTLVTFSDLVGELHNRVAEDAATHDIGAIKASNYASAVSLFGALACSRTTDLNNSLVTWSNSRNQARNLFSRQAVPMAWDFTEVNPFSGAAGDVEVSTNTAAKSIEGLPAMGRGSVSRQNAADRDYTGYAIATDPPYYDNIGYADLADFFYVWLRRSVQPFCPDEVETMLTPKREELVADPMRFDGDKTRAEEHFESGFMRVFSKISTQAADNTPISIFYAFKQAESEGEGIASTGWETMLAGLIRAGLSVTATWPVRTERSGRSRDNASNALASSIVLSCRRRSPDFGTATRRTFIGSLKNELPQSLNALQQGSIAPVDLAQAAIGPGMAVFSRYESVVEPDGKPMAVRTALMLINQVLDEALSEQEGDFDPDTRFCVKWFTQFGWGEEKSGSADTLSRATNTSVEGVERGSIFRAVGGKAHLLPFSKLTLNWDPATEDRISLWAVVLRMAKALAEVGGEEAARIMVAARSRGLDMDAAQELAYLLFSICEKRGLAQDAILFNGLGQSWSDLTSAARRTALAAPKPMQGSFDYDDEDSDD